VPRIHKNSINSIKGFEKQICNSYFRDDVWFRLLSVSGQRGASQKPLVTPWFIGQLCLEKAHSMKTLTHTKHLCFRKQSQFPKVFGISREMVVSYDNKTTV